MMRPNDLTFSSVPNTTLPNSLPEVSQSQAVEDEASFPSNIPNYSGTDACMYYHETEYNLQQ